MVTPMIIAILGIPLFISACLNFFFIVAWNDMRKREKERRERIDHEGTPIIATVTGVEHQKEQRKYVVYAQWCSRETGKFTTFRKPISSGEVPLEFVQKSIGEILFGSIFFLMSECTIWYGDSKRELAV